MTDIPPFPNSVNAQPPNQKHQIQKIEVDRMQARETNRKSEVVTTFYDAKPMYLKTVNSVRPHRKSVVKEYW